ncbi:hypothetical protein ACFL59_05175 [Planctomycetota bacterium]
MTVGSRQPDPGRELVAFEALAPHPGYTVGPAFVWEDWSSVQSVFHQPMPVVVVASYLEIRMVQAMDLTRVLGIVVDHGSVVDPLWDELVNLNRPTLIGARGIYDSVVPKETVIVDGALGYAVLRPSAELLDHYVELKGTRPPREPEHTRVLLAEMAGRIRQAWLHAQRRLPYDLAEQQRLYEIARRTADGGLPTAEDDAFVRRILFESG